MKYDSIKCTNCGGSITEGKFCPFCGSKLEEHVDSNVRVTNLKGRIYCPICNVSTEDEAVFRCSACGRDNICLHHKTDSNVCDQCDPEYQMREEKKRRRKELEQMIRVRKVYTLEKRRRVFFVIYLIFLLLFAIIISPNDIKPISALVLSCVVLYLLILLLLLQKKKRDDYDKKIEEFKRKHNIEAE